VRQWDKERPAPEFAVWAMGDPIYDKTDPRAEAKKDVAPAGRQPLKDYLAREGAKGDVKLPRLVSSGLEVRGLVDLFGVKQAEALTDWQASEAAVKAASRQGRLAKARYVHFATHGILGLDEGCQPSLVLNLVGNEEEDGFLQLDEVTNLKLNADLVVLSACRSGQGRLYNGEGVRGLARAFLYAGSKGVLCSLWSVDDRATADFMVDVYGHLKGGSTAPDALREAQLKMIRAGKAPLYWAPFIVIGE
jgi:CHAT domain-containing protein